MKMVAIVTLIITYQNTWAWGHLGHRTIGAIAERQLCPQAKTAARNILEGESLSEASTWADDVRGEPAFHYMTPWHFVSMPFGSDYDKIAKNPRGDVVSAIVEQTAKLHSANAAERKIALQLLIHFVGDAHQPLHAGHKEDHGANSVEVEWFGQPENLHSVWDSGLLDHLGLSFSELATFLDDPAKSYPPVAQERAAVWVNESSLIAKNIYPDLSGGIPKLAYAYYDAHIETAKRRLREAGVRLACLLNTELGCN